ncbi:MAG: hypothetical protein AB7I13_07510 [Vicinamibacterales bacterium]
MATHQQPAPSRGVPGTPRAETADRLPPRTLPLLYYGTAHVALALACAMVGLAPRAAAGFFYHAWMVAIVHLVTLGWITSSILGSLYLVGPMALGVPMPARRADYAAYGLVVLGLIGMVAHFWIEEFGGMAWSAATVTAGVLYVAGRMAVRLRGASIPGAVTLHIRLACLNLAIAATMGVLLGFDKVLHFLPGFVLNNVFAHAHMAALGWASMMVVGVGYRLLPMVLPSKPPAGRSTYLSAVLLETGVLGLFVTLLLRSTWTPVFGAFVLAGLAAFLSQVAAMARHRVRRPPEAPRVDFAVLHAAGAGVWLIAACGIGTVLLVRPMSPDTLRASLAYGTFGLLGFLAQMVVAMQVRLVPLHAWYAGYAASGFQTPPPNPFTMRDRTLLALSFAAWTFAVPAIAVGLTYERVLLLAAGAWVLLAGVLIGAVDGAFALRQGMTPPASGDPTADPSR